MVDLHIEYASMNLTVTMGKADTVNQNKCCKESSITSFTYVGLRCSVMKYGINILSINSLVKQVMYKICSVVQKKHHLKQMF